MRDHQRSLASPRPTPSRRLLGLGVALLVVASLAVGTPAARAAAPATSAPYAAPVGAATGAAEPTPEAALRRAASFVAGDRATTRMSRLSPLLRLGVPASASGSAKGSASGSGAEGTLVMRDLYRVADQLDGPDRARAQQILARPTDGVRDGFGDGYDTPSEQACSAKICLHWVSTGADAPPSRAWVTQNLKVLNRVWRVEVGKLGFRAPLPDGDRGGDSRFDVYLEDLGSTGAYGYCTPDQAVQASRSTAAGYCVLDNDFSPEQYAAAQPLTSLRVTAAHEFFHAVQFAYDYTEDPWFMESTAVWMEEQAAGGANDNRQYLSYGQLVDPAGPLDHFEGAGFTQYGNWVWWEYLSQRFGTGIVKKVWTRAAADKGRASYSTAALRRVLSARGGLPTVFADYASATTDAARSYPEGARWPAASTAGREVLSAASPSTTTRTTIDHLASSSYVFVPDDSLAGRRWALTVGVRGPGRATRPVGTVRIVRADGRISEEPLTFNAKGRARVRVPFGAARVERVTVTLANASTRSRCWQGTDTWSCQGTPRDDDQPFTMRVTAAER